MTKTAFLRSEIMFREWMRDQERDKLATLTKRRDLNARGFRARADAARQAREVEA